MPPPAADGREGDVHDGAPYGMPQPPAQLRKGLRLPTRHGPTTHDRDIIANDDFYGITP